MDKGSISVTITPGTILTAVGIGILFTALFFLRDLVLIVLAAIVLSSALEPGVLWLIKKNMVRGVAVSVVYAFVFAAFFVVTYLVFPPFADEARGFIVNLPQFANTLSVDVLSGITGEAGQSLISPSAVAEFIVGLQNLLIPSGASAFHAIWSILGGFLSFFLILLLSIYFSFQETGVDDFLRLVVPTKHRDYAINLWKRSHHKIGLWMQGHLVLALIMGVFGYLWLQIFQVPYAFFIAIFAAVMEIVPVFGSLISGTVAVVIAATAGGAELAAVIAAGFIVINLVQSNLVYPVVVKHVIGVPPLMVILAMIAGGQLAGFLGAILSVPVAAFIQELLSDVEKAKEREYALMKK